MAVLESKQILAFLESLGKRYPRPARLTVLGGSALCMLGSPRPTLDIDYVGDDLKKDELQKIMDEIALEMGLDVDAVPIHGFLPLPAGGEERTIHYGTFGQVKVSIIDPYLIALRKVERGFDTDIDDILFLIRHGQITFAQLEKVVKDSLTRGKEFDMN